MVKNQAERDVERFLSQFDKGRAEQLLASMGEKLLQEAQKPAADKVHLSLLCEQIAAVQQVVVSEEELHQLLSQEAKRLNVPKNRLSVDVARKSLANEKALQLVVEKARFIQAEQKP